MCITCIDIKSVVTVFLLLSAPLVSPQRSQDSDTFQGVVALRNIKFHIFRQLKLLVDLETAAELLLWQHQQVEEM